MADIVKHEKKSLISVIAARFEMEPVQFFETVKATVFNGKATNEEMAAFLAVAQEYELNPFTRELFAFPKKGGGIQPVVSIDGWIKLINSHPQFDGLEVGFDISENGKPYAVHCQIHRKDRAHATKITEYFSECYRDTEPWNKMPFRMLRHKGIKECARVAFGFAGITDEDEALDVLAAEPVNEIQSATQKKTEALKNRLVAATPSTATPPEAPASNSPASEPQKEQDEIQESLAPPPPQTENISPAMKRAKETFQKKASEQPALTEGLQPITAEQKKALIEALRARGCKRDEALNGIARYGYERPEQIQVKNFGPLMKWAETGKFE